MATIAAIEISKEIYKAIGTPFILFFGLFGLIILLIRLYLQFYTRNKPNKGGKQPKSSGTLQHKK